MSLAAFLASVLGLWSVSCFCSGRVRYVSKYVILIGYTSTVAAVLLLQAALRPWDVKNANISTWAVSWITPFLGLRYRVLGEEHLREDRAAVVICNHQSLLDFLGMCRLWPIAGKLAAIAKREILFIWPFGTIAWLSGTVFINRGRPGESRDVVNNMEDKIKKEKIKLWVFAEGTRSDCGELLPFKKGGFHLAKQGNLPIIPVVMSWYGPFLDHKAMRFDPGEVTIKILPAVSTDTDEDITSLTNRVRDDMQATLVSISPMLQQKRNKLAVGDSGDSIKEENGLSESM